MTNSPRALYCQELNEALAGDPARFADLLLERWTGSDGPALDDDRSWTDILFRGYRDCPPERKAAWARVLGDILESFPPGRLSRWTTLERLQLLGALELAQGIQWPEEEAPRLRSYLASCLELALSPQFPPPRDLWKEERLLGQPESDLLTAVLRVAVRQLEWSSFGERHWNLALESSKKLGPLICAGRLWEIARWASARGELKWLAPRVLTLIDKLKEADHTPGNLTLLLFWMEIERGAEAVESLILAVLDSLRRGYPPLDPQRRTEVAEDLDYLGPKKYEIREQLRRLRGEPAEQLYMSPEVDHELKDFVDGWERWRRRLRPPTEPQEAFH